MIKIILSVGFGLIILLNFGLVLGGNVVRSGWFSVSMVVMAGLLWGVFGVFLLLLVIGGFELNLLGVVMTLVFFRGRVWVLVLWFEFMLIPIMAAILSAGANPARVSATMYLLFYTIFLSLPVLMLLMGVYFYGLFYSPLEASVVFTVWMVLSFGVKVPVYGFHLWLPKAHVEASTMGSMVLAGALLKGGTYGVFLVRIWLNHYVRAV
jgi:NADH:ubiquinone oxidoreductase subunit 4 (subunit M)